MDKQVRIEELKGEAEEIRELQRVLELTPTYAQRVTGYPPGHADAQSTAIALPENKTYDDKFLYGIYLGEEMVGCADIIRAYPESDTALVGLFLISEAKQGQGIGKVAYQSLEATIRTWQEIKRLRLGVVRTNEIVLPFWKKMGFCLTGEVKPYQYDKLQSETLILEKYL